MQRRTGARESASAFERWCDNRMIEMLKPQKYEAFSVGPLLGYFDRKRDGDQDRTDYTDRKTERFFGRGDQGKDKGDVCIR